MDMCVLKEKLITPRVKKETRELVILFAIIMFLRTFFYQPFNIPSGSMIPTLLVGDFLVVNKFCYGYGNETFPLRFQILNHRLFHKDPQRGDIVVFNNPKHIEMGWVSKTFGMSGEKLDYIKRLIGLPGDRIQVKDGVLHINGEPVKLERIEDYQDIDERGRFQVIQQYIETLPNGVKHSILKMFSFGRGHYDNTPEFVVPEDHYFMMGDNRDNSIDSREPSRVGFIHKDLLLGRADLIFFSTKAKWYQIQEWLFGLRPSRFFTVLR